MSVACCLLAPLLCQSESSLQVRQQTVTSFLGQHGQELMDGEGKGREAGTAQLLEAC